LPLPARGIIGPNLLRINAVLEPSALQGIIMAPLPVSAPMLASIRLAVQFPALAANAKASMANPQVWTWLRPANGSCPLKTFTGQSGFRQSYEWAFTCSQHPMLLKGVSWMLLAQPHGA
jgi:hypothetical protein